MRRLLWPLAVLIVPAVLAVAGLLLIRSVPSAPAAPSGTTATVGPAASPSPASTATAGSPTAGSTPRAARRPRHGRRRAGPWAVVSAYYRAVDAHRYARAWTLIDSGLATGQTYGQFVAGYRCTGTETPTRLSQAGHRVAFRLKVLDDCTGAVQYYAGTDTVRGGTIVAADVVRTG